MSSSLSSLADNLAKNMRFLGLWQKSNPFMCTFLREYEGINGLLISAKITCLEKYGS